MAATSVDILKRLHETILIAENAGYRMSVFWVGTKANAREYCSVNGGVDAKIFMCMKACFNLYNPETDDQPEINFPADPTPDECDQHISILPIQLDCRDHATLSNYGANADNDQPVTNFAVGPTQDQFDRSKMNLPVPHGPDHVTVFNDATGACLEDWALVKSEPQLQCSSDLPISRCTPLTSVLPSQPMTAHRPMLNRPSDGADVAAIAHTVLRDEEPNTQGELVNGFDSESIPDNLVPKSNTHDEDPEALAKSDHVTTTLYDPLQAQQRTQSQKHPHKCPRCNYTCNRLSNMKTHIRTHSGERPYKCQQCTYAAATKSCLQVHKRTHTRERPYKCSQCDYRFADRGNLKRHFKIHTGERPFKCQYCNYASVQYTSLKHHTVTKHAQQRPHKCPRCDFKSSRRSDLVAHLGTHSREVVKMPAL